MAKRIKTNYPGIFYREVKRIGGKGNERVYYVLFKKDGKVFEEKAGRQYVNAMTPARAARIRAERIEGRRQSKKEIREAEKNRWTINRLWGEYKKGNPSLKGIKTDENRFKNHIGPYFGNREPKDIAPLDVDRLRIRLLKVKSPGTVKNILELLRRIVNFGTRKQLCEGLRFKVEMPRVENEKTEDLSPEQLTRLLDAINGSFDIQAANMMRMVLFCGMRRGELFKLRWKDIDFDRAFIEIRDPKGGKGQKIPLNDEARQLLESHPQSHSVYVFPGRGGKQRTDINHQVKKIKEKAGLPKDFRPLHGLRHTYASMLASSGKVDMYHLQKLLTHKGPVMTQRYAHLRDEGLKKASNLAGEIITEAIRNKEKIIELEDHKK